MKLKYNLGEPLGRFDEDGYSRIWREGMRKEYYIEGPAVCTRMTLQSWEEEEFEKPILRGDCKSWRGWSNIADTFTYIQRGPLPPQEAPVPHNVYQY